MNSFKVSVSPIDERSISALKLWSAKHISNKVVIKPPAETSCPATILSFLIKFVNKIKSLFEKICHP